MPGMGETNAWQKTTDRDQKTREFYEVPNCAS
jgi:hypothetical protein